jgi:hypothetical protein
MGKIVKKGSMQGRYQWFEPVILNYAGGWDWENCGSISMEKKLSSHQQ